MAKITLKGSERTAMPGAQVLAPSDPGEWSNPGATQPGKRDRQRLVAADASVQSHYVAVD